MKAKQEAIIGEINITPLTDIFLVLLIIMMVIAPLLDYRGLNVALMSPTTADLPKDEPKKTKVEIDAQGLFKVAGESVSPDGLAVAIKNDAEAHPDGLIIESHSDATLEAMTRVMDAARIAGVAKVSIMETGGSSPESSSGATPPKASAPKR